MPKKPNPRSSERQIWSKMLSRCSNPNRKNYGARGIKVCESWNDFEVFYQDMGPRPKGYSIDRINPNGNYEPSNCRWASNTQQANNRRTTKWVQFNGDMRPVSEVADVLGVPREKLYHQMILRKRTLEDALVRIQELERCRQANYAQRRSQHLGVAS